MANYVGKVGGSKWSALVVEQRRRNRDAVQELRRLEAAASTDATRLLVVRVQNKLLENLAELETLLLMATAGGEGGGE